MRILINQINSNNSINLRSASGIELVSDELVEVMLLSDGLPGPCGLLSSPPAAGKNITIKRNTTTTIQSYFK